jgi:hypothetical protein
MKEFDLWSDPFPINEEQPDVNEPQKKKRGRPKKDKPKDLSNLYVITAGINKATERQMFVSSFEDSDKWSISVVPFVMNKDDALKLMEKAQQFINDNPNRYRHKPPTLALESIENPEIYKWVRYIL